MIRDEEKIIISAINKNLSDQHEKLDKIEAGVMRLITEKKTLIALIYEMVNAEESSDGENRAIYANVAKMIIDSQYEYDENVEDILRQWISEAHKEGYFGGYKVNW